MGFLNCEWWWKKQHKKNNTRTHKSKKFLKLWKTKQNRIFAHENLGLGISTYAGLGAWSIYQKTLVFSKNSNFFENWKI